MELKKIIFACDDDTLRERTRWNELCAKVTGVSFDGAKNAESAKRFCTAVLEMEGFVGEFQLDYPAKHVSPVESSPLDGVQDSSSKQPFSPAKAPSSGIKSDWTLRITARTTLL